MKNKKVIVTGAGAGIGLELALQLLNQGAEVAGLDINKEGLENLKLKSNNNKKLTTYIVDISDDKSLNKFKTDYYKDNKYADILINNAGIIQPFVNVNDLEFKLIEKVMDINFYGPLKLTRMFLPEMIKRSSGHIVNVSSMGGFFPFPKQTVYGASKAALKLFTEGLYAELLDTNIKVMIVFPGAIATDIMKNSNVESSSSDNSTYKMLPANEAASQIIDGMIKNKFQLYVGSDSKMMNLMYKLNPKSAIKFINKKMQ